MKEIFSDVIRYWEKRRIIYNLGLASVVAVVFILGYPDSLERVKFVLFLNFFLLAVLANVFYTSAYIIDVFVQLSEFTEGWKKFRWALFIIGFLFALIVSWFISKGLFRISGKHV